MPVAEHRGRTARVYPGVSAVDTVLVDLQHDIGVTGLQVFGASWMVGHGVLPLASVPCIVLQINAFGTVYHTDGVELRPGGLAPLRDHLLQVYPPDHEVIFVESPVFWFEDGRRHPVRLGDLGDVGSRETLTSTLFIPAASTPPVVNQEFAKRMYDPGYFAEAYRRVEWPGGQTPSPTAPKSAQNES